MIRYHEITDSKTCLNTVLLIIMLPTKASWEKIRLDSLMWRIRFLDNGFPFLRMNLKIYEGFTYWTYHKKYISRLAKNQWEIAVIITLKLIITFYQKCSGVHSQNEEDVTKCKPLNTLVRVNSLNGWTAAHSW